VSGIAVESYGLPATCLVRLSGVPGSSTETECTSIIAVLAPAADTSYQVVIQARTASGSSQAIAAMVRTDP
jgi:hypothetical protein